MISLISWSVMPAPDAPQLLDLSAPRRIHFVGIGGIGLSGIATLLVRLGHHVTGSDIKESRALDRLRLLGIDVAVGHAPANVRAGTDAVVVSTAIASSNPEVGAANDAGIAVLRRADMLRLIVATRRTVAVSGTHGKTTTSSMVALILRQAGFQPSFLIGGDVNEVGANAVFDQGDWLVVEADESDGTFIEIAAEAVVVTNVEADHLDYFGDLDSIAEAFHRFLADAPGVRVAPADDPIGAQLAGATSAITFGESAGADYRVVDYSGRRGASRFHLWRGGDDLGEVKLPVPGRHNARNAAAAAAVCMELGAPFPAVSAALARFGGVARRFQIRGVAGGVTFVDDYAHNPGKVRAVLAAAREGEWRRVIAVFQPHRYSRTADLWRDFADSFVDADIAFITDVYGAGESARPGVTGQLVVDAVLGGHPDADVRYIPKRADVIGPVLAVAGPGDLVLAMGAGDITTLPDELLARAARP
jgi:UDP-N-acetylmuramate--alanine ligase